MWHRTRLTELLPLQYPIVQGPFGGGNSSVDLVAAVSEAGGLGSMGVVNLSPDQIRATVKEIRARTRHPFNLNLWVPIQGQDTVQPESHTWERAVQRVTPLLQSVGLAVPARPEAFAVPYHQQLEALLEARPPVWSVVMGVPDDAAIREARARGIVTFGTATTVDEAVALDEAGVDVIVASGSDAGGHRSSFLRAAEDSLVGTFSLIPQVVDAVRAPVVAAGGVADGRGVAAALTLGASGVQVGTAFLAAHESGAPAVHKAVLGTPRARWTRLTRAITGRHARGVVNTLMNTLEANLQDVLTYPAQNWLTTALRKQAGALGRDEMLALWAGQNAASARSQPAADVLARLVHETETALRPRLEGQAR